MARRETTLGPLPITWQSLNKRQKEYLTAIYHADQEVEASEKARWSHGDKPRPAIEWRWMVYATVDGTDTPVKRHLRSTKQVNEGTGSTLEALEKRKLINVRYDITTYNGFPLMSNDPIPTIQITPAGRKMVRQALDILSTNVPAGTLQEWHWQALTYAYANEQKKTEDNRISGKTWLRLRNYTIIQREYPLVDRSLHLTPFEIAYYKRC